MSVMNSSKVRIIVNITARKSVGRNTSEVLAIQSVFLMLLSFGHFMQCPGHKRISVTLFNGHCIMQIGDRITLSYLYI